MTVPAKVRVAEFGSFSTLDDIGVLVEKGSNLCAGIKCLDSAMVRGYGYTKTNTTSLNKDHVLAIHQNQTKYGTFNKTYVVGDATSSVIQSGEGAMAVIKTGLKPTEFWDAATLNGYIHYANGLNRMQQSDGITTWQCGIAMNGAVPTYNSTISGSLEVGANYYFRYTYYNENTGAESSCSAASAVMNTGAANGLRINIPANASIDTQVTHVKVYRTLANPSSSDASITFYDGQKAYTGTAITYNSTTADISLSNFTAPTDNGVPPIGTCIEEFGSTLFVAGTNVYSTGNVNVTNGDATVSAGASPPLFWADCVGAKFRIDGDTKEYTIASYTSSTAIELTEAYSGTSGTNKTYYIYRENSTLYFSQFSGNTAYPNIFPQSNYIPVGDMGEGIIGLQGTSAYLCIFKRNQIFKLSGTNPNFYLLRISDSNGAVSNKAIAADHVGRIIFYSGDNVYVTGGSQPELLDPQNKMWYYFKDEVDHTYDYASHMVFDPINKEMNLWVTTHGHTSPNKMIAYDLLRDVWTVFDIPATASGVVTDPLGNQVVYFGDSYGFVYQYATGENYGAGTTGTRRGLITAATANTLEDTLATFDTTGSGLKGVRVWINYGVGAGQYATITSNTATTLTVDAWSGGVTPTLPAFYCIGATNSYYWTRHNDYGVPDMNKQIYDMRITNRLEQSGAYIKVHGFKGIKSPGTIAVTKGSASVTGTGTNFTADDIGRPIRLWAEWKEYYIANVVSTTSIVLSEPYTGATGSGKDYMIPASETVIDLSEGTSSLAFIHVYARHAAYRFGRLDVDYKFKLYNFAPRVRVLGLYK